jgi:hypothetical protein
LICCETCPATFHTECIGLSEVPVDDWFCPACTACAHSRRGGGGGNKRKVATSLPASPELIPCTNYSSHRLKPTEDEEEKAREEGNEVINGQQALNSGRNGGGSDGGDGQQGKNSQLLYRKLHVEDTGQLPPLYAIQQQQKEQLATPQQQEEGGQQQDGGGSVVPKSLLPLVGDNEEEKELQRQRILAECCALGAIPIGQVNAATNPLQISFQLIHTAAATATAPAAPSPITNPTTTKSPRSRGRTSSKTSSSSATPRIVMPAYSEAQKSDLRNILSAAFHLVHTVYTPLFDSRTGVDILPWLFRGKTFTKSEFTDYSTMHVAVLYVGSTIAGVACVRSLGTGIAEIPIFLVREELRRNRLGENFLAQIEKVLYHAGIELIITPAMILPGWPFTPSSFPRENIPAAAPSSEGAEAAADTHFPVAPPLPMQFKWGYTLGTKEEMQRIANVRPLAFPGVYTCVKRLCHQEEEEEEEEDVEKNSVEVVEGQTNSLISNTKPLVPRTLPSSLAIAPEIHVEFLRLMGFIELRSDQGKSDVIRMNAAPGYELVIKTAVDGGVNVNGNGGGGFNRQGSVERRASRGATRTSNGVGGDGEMNGEPLLLPQQQEVPFPAVVSPPKRKYTKRKQQQQQGDEMNGAGVSPRTEKGGGGGKRGRGRGKKIISPSTQPPQVLQQQQQQHPDFNPLGGGLGFGSTMGTVLPPAQFQYQQQQQQLLPPGAPVLRSLVHPNQPLALHPAPLEDLASLKQLQTIQAQQLAQMEEAIRHEQANLLQGMNRFREQQEQQQQMAAMAQQQQQQQQHQGLQGQQQLYNNGYAVQHNINGNMLGVNGGYLGNNQGQQPIYNGTVAGAGGGAGGGGGYFQQQFDHLPPLQSIYENHQRIQQQQQQFQNSLALPMPPLQAAPPPLPSSLLPGQGYYPSSQPQPQQQHQQQGMNPLPMPQGLAPPPYYYGSGSG